MAQVFLAEKSLEMPSELFAAQLRNRGAGPSEFIFNTFIAVMTFPSERSMSVHFR